MGDVTQLKARCFARSALLPALVAPPYCLPQHEMKPSAAMALRCICAAELPDLTLGLLAVPQAEGGEWKPELLFMVPREHEEIQRLEGRYKK